MLVDPLAELAEDEQSRVTDGDVGRVGHLQQGVDHLGYHFVLVPASPQKQCQIIFSWTRMIK